MGQKDTITKRYMSKPEYFADAFNYYVFGGEQIIRPENLVEQDPVEIGIIPLELYDSKDNEMVQKFRDVLKECVLMQDEKVAYLLLGIENQSDVHYAMPVRNMVYDALNYGKQVSDIARKHRLHGESGHSRAEYLSGFYKTDLQNLSEKAHGFNCGMRACSAEAVNLEYIEFMIFLYFLCKTCLFMCIIYDIIYT